MEIPWIADPRRAGSDCWGFLISKTQDSLDRLVADIHSRQKEQEKCEKEFESAQSWEEKEKVLESYDFFCEENIREHVWEAYEDDVIEVSTDWKHLEISDHAKKLQYVGISMNCVYREDEEGKQKPVVTFCPLSVDEN